MKGRVLHTDATPTLGPALHLRRIHGGFTRKSMKLKTDPSTADKTTSTWTGATMNGGDETRRAAQDEDHADDARHDMPPSERVRKTQRETN